MDILQHRLLIEQVDNKIYKLKWFSQESPPGDGWIRALRISLGMSLKQLGQRMGMSPQGVKAIEKREQEGALTLDKMREAGKAMQMKFVYGYVPYAGSVEHTIEKRARELATEIVQRTSGTMRLEDQEIGEKRLKSAIRERTADIINSMPGYLWD